jgi:hypothetical protein
MGVAFLLLETRNIVVFALLFGTTWFVNAIVFASVLLTVLAAVELSRRVKFQRRLPLYALLLLSIVVAWLVPTHSLLQLGLLTRLVAATGLGFAPVFFANLVFSQRFREVQARRPLVPTCWGAMVGGALEYSSLLGYRALLIVVGVLYGLAFVLLPKTGPQSAPA